MDGKSYKPLRKGMAKAHRITEDEAPDDERESMSIVFSPVQCDPREYIAGLPKKSSELILFPE